MTDLATLFACPRCDLTPLDRRDTDLHCKACDVDFPSINGIPWMFAEPQAALGEWRGRLQFALQQLSHEVAGLENELKKDDLHSLSRRRVERYKKAVEYHQRALAKLLRPVDMQAAHGNYETYLALRTRLPADQGLNTYYANIHRDWTWGDEENVASLKQVRSVLHDHAVLGNVSPHRSPVDMLRPRHLHRHATLLLEQVQLLHGPVGREDQRHALALVDQVALRVLGDHQKATVLRVLRRRNILVS